MLEEILAGTFKMSDQRKNMQFHLVIKKLVIKIRKLVIKHIK